MTKTKIRQLISWQRTTAFVCLALLIMAGMYKPLAAQNVTQGYDADQPLQRGMIVQLKKDDSTKIEPVSSDTMERMHGIVVDPNDAPVTLSADGRKVFVATRGHFDILVTNQNGPIQTGDYISISALPGIGMKVDGKQSVVVGKSLSSFDGSSSVLSQVDLKEGNGGTKTVSIGRVQLDIGIGPNPLVQPTETNLPGFLKKATEAIADKPISPARVYLTLGIFLATTVIAGSTLYAGVRSSIIAMGRNPLSKKSITRSLIQVILTSLIIFLTGIFGVYLLLKF